MTAPVDPNLPIPFAGGFLDHYRHACAFFNSADEEHRVMDPYVREGFERGEKGFHIIDPDLRDDYLQRLQAAGIDAPVLLERGQFELKTWYEAYIREGRFDQEAMLQLIEEVLQAGHREGFPITRLVAHMEWSLQDFPGVQDLVEYETRLNYVLPRYKDPVI